MLTLKVIQDVVGERAGRAVGRAAGDVAKAVVAASVDLPRLVGTGGSGGVESGQLVRLAR